MVPTTNQMDNILVTFNMVPVNAPPLIGLNSLDTYQIMI